MAFVVFDLDNAVGGDNPSGYWIIACFLRLGLKILLVEVLI